MDLAPLTAAYQATLEHHRFAVEDSAPEEVVEQLAEDLERAKRALEVAWLEQKFRS